MGGEYDYPPQVLKYLAMPVYRIRNEPKGCIECFNVSAFLLVSVRNESTTMLLLWLLYEMLSYSIN